jgi:hypothetical protein
MADGKGIDGIALATMAGGAIFAYASIRGYSVLALVQSVVSGKSPKTLTPSETIGTPQQSQNSAQSQNAPVGGTSNPNAGTWTHSGLMTLWQQAGGSSATANNAACHAIQESSGNASVTSPNPDGGTNVGLWQLDTKGVGKGYTVSQLQDPRINARVTVQGTNNGRDWSEWATPGC